MTFTVQSEDASWEIEANSVSILRRMDLTADVVQVGDTVTVAGWPPKQAEHSMFLTNMLIGGGPEIIFWPGTPPRWSEDTAGTSATWMVTEADLPADAPDGIFRVWSTTLAYGPENFLFEGFDFPLTDTAQAARAGYDLTDSPILGSCVHKGMPTIMEQPYPMALVPGDGVIYLRMEEGDAVRTIHMTPGDPPPAHRPHGPLGRSMGGRDARGDDHRQHVAAHRHDGGAEHRGHRDGGAIHAQRRRQTARLHADPHQPGHLHRTAHVHQALALAADAAVEPYACEVEADR